MMKDRKYSTFLDQFNNAQETDDVTALWQEINNPQKQTKKKHASLSM